MDKIRLLLVDDSITFLDNIAGFLAEFKDLVVVGTAHNGDEALCLAADLQPDIVLLDVNMPGLSGIEIIPHLRQILPGAGIIILSFQNSDIYKGAALVAGADAFLPKETLTDELIPAINRVFKRNERLASVE